MRPLRWATARNIDSDSNAGRNQKSRNPDGLEGNRKGRSRKDPTWKL